MKSPFEGKLYHVLEQRREELMTLHCFVLCRLPRYSLVQLAGSLTHWVRQPLIIKSVCKCVESALHTHPRYEWWQVVDMNHRLLEALAFSLSLNQIVNISKTVMVIMSGHLSHWAASCNMGHITLKKWTTRWKRFIFQWNRFYLTPIALRWRHCVCVYTIYFYDDLDCMELINWVMLTKHSRNVKCWIRPC